MVPLVDMCESTTKSVTEAIAVDGIQQGNFSCVRVAGNFSIEEFHGSKGEVYLVPSDVNSYLEKTLGECYSKNLVTLSLGLAENTD